jgi:hypothetical protein
VKRVDVSVDGGRTYKEAPLQQPVLRYARDAEPVSRLFLGFLRDPALLTRP